MKQAQLFIDKEGDRWFERNAARLGEHDPVCSAIEQKGIRPKSVLEIGCSNGWRLAKLRDKYGCNIMGLDPSHAAAEDARTRKVTVWTATAAAMPIRSHAFDLVIYGWCLYLTDPDDWFRIATEGDRVLQNEGYLIIHDFNTGDSAYARKYEHAEDILSYHVQWSKLWLAHPWYMRIYGKQEGLDEAVTILRKRHGSIPVTA
jgi:ubiquinone/menaquinone biosynthesis C-methylase UbiE